MQYREANTRDSRLHLVEKHNVSYRCFKSEKGQQEAAQC